MRLRRASGPIRKARLQIYKDGQMVGDCSVPKGLKVTGYIEPYYYSQVFNDNDEGLTIYRFKL